MTRAERLEEIRKRWVEPAPGGAPHFPYDMTNEAAEDIPWLLSEIERMQAALLEIQNHTTEAATDDIAREALNG